VAEAARKRASFDKRGASKERGEERERTNRKRELWVRDAIE
jgi:hypothetical protein